jgi:hypothetical protein
MSHIHILLQVFQVHPITGLSGPEGVIHEFEGNALILKLPVFVVNHSEDITFQWQDLTVQFH